eukprot:jgi/Botrbrau1/1890/Bobra.0005s0006.1
MPFGGWGSFTVVAGTLLLHGVAKMQARETACSSFKVALLFLTVGPMPHERLWRRWFDDVAGLIPLEQLKQRNCSERHVARLRSSCQPPAGASPVEAQHLFTVYIHPKPDFPAYPEGSVFHKREIAVRIHVRWGYHSQTLATRELIKAALAEPSNGKFVMLSESCIPLYPPTTIYLMLSTEPKSRINACSSTKDRWRPEYVRGSGSVKVPDVAWRVGSQWVALTREHAVVVTNDTELLRRFASVCRELEAKKKACHSIESYFAVVLAYHDRDNETDCMGHLHWADWSQSIDGHPAEFGAANVTRNLIKRARNLLCLSAPAIRMSAPMFVPARDAQQSLCLIDNTWVDRMLDWGCELFARKFAPAAASAIQTLYSDCEQHLDILKCAEGRRHLLEGLLGD